MYFKSLLLIILLIAIAFVSCNPDDESYPDEDLVYRYIRENDSLFYEKEDYYLLFFKRPMMTCVDKTINYQADPLIRGHLDTARNIPLFVVTNNQMLKKWSTFFYQGEDAPVIHMENYKTMEAYGIPYTPLLFRFDNGEISHWRYLNNNLE